MSDNWLLDNSNAFDPYYDPVSAENFIENTSSNLLFFEEIKYESWHSDKVIKVINKFKFLLENSRLTTEDKEFYQYIINDGYYKNLNGLYFHKENYVRLLKDIYQLIEKSLGQLNIDELLNKFELSVEEQYRKIERTKKSIRIIVRELSIKHKKDEILEYLSDLSDETLIQVIESNVLDDKLEEIYSKEDSSSKKLDKIKNEIILFKAGLSDITYGYMKSHNIDPNMLNVSEAHIYSEEEINSITKRYGIKNNCVNANISIGKIIGYDGFLEPSKRNILISMSNYFDSSPYADSYHSRSNGMLEFNSIDDALSKLNDSFIKEPIVIKEVEKDKYVITSNGLHRYTILRILYLKELLNGEKQQELQSKYIIPVRLSTLDYVKTYCNFLLQRINKNIKYVSRRLDCNHNYTDNIEIIYSDGKKEIVDEETLLQRVRSSIEIAEESIISEISKLYQESESFKEFIDSYLPTLKLENGVDKNVTI